MGEDCLNPSPSDLITSCHHPPLPPLLRPAALPVLSHLSCDRHRKEMWSKLEVQCNGRSSRIHEFREGLEHIETLRSAAVGGELRRLVDDLVSIACRMPDEIERIAEVGGEAFLVKYWGGRSGSARRRAPGPGVSSELRHAYVPDVLYTRLVPWRVRVRARTLEV